MLLKQKCIDLVMQFFKQKGIGIHFLFNRGIVCFLTIFLTQDINFFNMFLFFQKQESLIFIFEKSMINMIIDF